MPNSKLKPFKGKSLSLTCLCSPIYCVNQSLYYKQDFAQTSWNNVFSPMKQCILEHNGISSQWAFTDTQLPLGFLRGLRLRKARL